VKLRISQKPKTACTLRPACIGFSSLPLLMQLAIILEPASPNPSTSKWLIFVIACSSSSVSRVLSLILFPSSLWTSSSRSSWWNSKF
jgi:hypothetical protein